MFSLLNPLLFGLIVYDLARFFPSMLLTITSTSIISIHGMAVFITLGFVLSVAYMITYEAVWDSQRYDKYGNYLTKNQLEHSTDQRFFFTMIIIIAILHLFQTNYNFK